MIGLILDLLFSRKSNSAPLTSLVLDGVNRFYNLRHDSLLFNKREKHRLLSLFRNTLVKRDPNYKSTKFPTLNVIIVAIDKDFPLLQSVISGVSKSCQSFTITSIDLVVPSHSINHQALLNLSEKFPLIRIIDEKAVINTEGIKRCFSLHFPGRENWCLQQFLKYFSVLASKADYVFVVDADTVVLQSIIWLTHDGKLAQMPTLEYQEQYYKVLFELGVISELPEFSFVPHHMIYSKEEFLNMHKFIGSPLPMQLAERLVSVSASVSSSPFCIDYELYAQYMFKHKRDKVRLVRWANGNISRNSYSRLERIPGAITLLRFFFNSISIHSWNQ